MASSEFSHARRLKDFLTYVVAETISGRGESISGRTIAQDVYQRGTAENDSDLSVVRVDAGRLRRRLAAYYAEDGKEDPVQISIPVGSYTPVFAKQESEPKPPVPAARDRAPVGWKTVFAGLLVIAVTLIAAGLFMQNNEPTDTARALDQGREAAIRRALLSKSPTSLQAVNQAVQARELLFPALDARRLELVGALFENVIALDDEYFGGYAGAAQAYASLSLLEPSQERRTALFERSRTLGDRAISLRPDSAWAHSAAAFVLFAGRDYEAALVASERAVSLDSNDSYVKELDSLIALFSGEFSRARDRANEAIELNPGAPRTTAHNVLGTASFHLGDYNAAIAQIMSAIEGGNPISQISVFYLAASYQAVGQYENARQMAAYYANAWGANRVDGFLSSLFHSSVDIEPLTRWFDEALAATAQN